MNHFLLIGHPIIQSVSPEIHQKLAALSAMPCDYRSLDVEPGRLAETLPSLRQVNGFNITIPYKHEIMTLLDGYDSVIARIGAVNTVKCEGGHLYGYNTDREGFLRALESAGILLAGSVLLCGAGGTARMMACEALARGCRLLVATRKLSGAKALAEELQKLYPDAEISFGTLAYLSGSYDLILNATPCGMYPDIRSMPVPAAVARSARAVFDAVYNPLETALLKAARAAGAKTQGGLPMLVWQAAAAQRIWTGAEFARPEVEKICQSMAELIRDKYC